MEYRDRFIGSMLNLMDYATQKNKVPPVEVYYDEKLIEKKKLMDRIIIESPEKMNMMMDWYFEHEPIIREYGLEIKPPLSQGIIEEENVEYMFEQDGNNVVLTIFMKSEDYPYLRDIEFITVTFNFVTKEVKDQNFMRNWDEVTKSKVKTVAEFFDLVTYKIEVYCALMLFMAFFEGEVIEVDESKNEQRNKRAVRKMKQKTRKPISLIKKTYVLKDMKKRQMKKLQIPGLPRKYTKPDHEVRSRGHFRHMKNGKIVWVKESVRYKDKPKQPKEYKL